MLMLNFILDFFKRRKIEKCTIKYESIFYENPGCIKCANFDNHRKKCYIYLKDFEKTIDEYIETHINEKTTIREICKDIYRDKRLNISHLICDSFYPFYETNSRKYFSKKYAYVNKKLYDPMYLYLLHFYNKFIVVDIGRNESSSDFYGYCYALGMDTDFYVEYCIRNSIINNKKLEIPFVDYNADNRCIFFNNKIGGSQ